MSDFDDRSLTSWRENRRKREAQEASAAQEQSASPRPTERLFELDETEEEESQTRPLNANWRRGREEETRSRHRRAAGVMTSPQEFQLWLQKGGWLAVAGVAALVVIVLVFLLINRDSSSLQDQFAQDTAAGNATSVAEGVVIPGAEGGDGTVLTEQPTLTPAPTTPAAGATQAFVVFNTGGQGLFLRDGTGTDAQILTTLPDGTRVEATGTEDVIGSSYVWREVQTPGGQTGWVAVDFLQEAP